MRDRLDRDRAVPESPWATLRVVDEQTIGSVVKAVDVLVDDEVVARLPATSIGYKLDVRGTSELLVGVAVGQALIVAGQVASENVVCVHDWVVTSDKPDYSWCAKCGAVRT